MTGAARVVLDGVSKAFGVTSAVERVSLTVEPGELVTLLGPSGCGKTTTLRMVAGLEVPTAGRVFIGGEDVTALPANARDVSMVFQSYALFPHLTVSENVAYGLTVLKRPAAEVRRAVEEALALAGLSGLGDRSPAALSGGQQQRVAVARALVLKPKVLLFDEPLSNLDAKLRKRMRAEIRALQKRAGITSLYVTHDQAEALAISDRVVVMEKGRVAQVGTPVDLYARPASRFVAEFIGEANLLPATLTGYQDGAALVRLDALTLKVPGPPLPPGPITLMARPEAIRLQQEGPGLPGVIEKVAYLGAVAEYTVTTAVGAIQVSDSQVEAGLLPAGTSVRLEFLQKGLYPLPPVPGGSEGKEGPGA